MTGGITGTAPNLLGSLTGKKRMKVYLSPIFIPTCLRFEPTHPAEKEADVPHRGPGDG